MPVFVRVRLKYITLFYKPLYGIKTSTELSLHLQRTDSLVTNYIQTANEHYKKKKKSRHLRKGEIIFEEVAEILFSLLMFSTTLYEIFKYTEKLK